MKKISSIFIHWHLLSVYMAILLSASSVLGQDVIKDNFVESKTTIGGYGELHFNYQADAEGKRVKQAFDFHRFVLFFGHAFNERWSFKSEVEIEHNFVQGGHGELELEQAYIDWRPSELIGLQAGVLLAPVGYINENHEPVLFNAVERPDYQKYIIPTTWFANGVALYGASHGLEYKLQIMDGLNGDKIDAKKRYS